MKSNLGASLPYKSTCNEQEGDTVHCKGDKEIDNGREMVLRYSHGLLDLSWRVSSLRPPRLGVGSEDSAITELSRAQLSTPEHTCQSLFTKGETWITNQQLAGAKFSEMV